MDTTLSPTSADVKSYRILTIAFAAMTAIMFALSWNTRPVLLLTTTGILLACTLALRAAWLCETRYAPTPRDPWWQPLVVERILRMWLLGRLTEILLAMFFVASIMPPCHAPNTRQYSMTPGPGESTRRSDSSVPEPECPRVVPYVTKRGEVFWCAYARPFSDSPCATAGEIDGRTCLSRQAPGKFWSRKLWCDRGKTHVTVIYRNTQGNFIECTDNIPRLCSPEDYYKGGSKFCVDYSTCQPHQQHHDDKSCYVE